MISAYGILIVYQSQYTELSLYFHIVYGRYAIVKTLSSSK